MGIASLGYVVIDSADPAAWRSFGTDVLGLMATDTADGGVRLRMDDRPFRFAIGKAEADKFVAAGWEFASEADYHSTLKALSEAGVELTPGTAADAADRKVRALSRCKDPSGNTLELYHGRVYDYAPFVSPKGVSGFITGNMGLGHVVLPAPKVEETRSFYKNFLGFGDTDEMRVPIGVPDHPGLALYFLHCDNPRHHSLALFEADIPSGCIHVMVEVEKLDDVGYAIDRCKRGGARSRSISAAIRTTAWSRSTSSLHPDSTSSMAGTVGRSIGRTMSRPRARSSACGAIRR